ncbi:MAG: YraN family protein [Proteobacteria bacterium]|nr:YraN family protein [Pseudomonadota bacterium]
MVLHPEKKEIGQKGENLAVEYLQKLGYKVLERNYRCKLGEVDIIALDNDTLVFIEVRTRSSLDFGLPQESINRRKRHQISKVALEYMIRRKLKNIPARFDVVAISLEPGKEKVDHIKDAFELT